MKDVTGAATPVARSPVASRITVNVPAVDVTLEMTDDPEYIVSPGVVPAGPQIWKITNTRMQPNHYVVRL
jgi:hypothetical protein